jgi:hypothetical protein
MTFTIAELRFEMANELLAAAEAEDLPRVQWLIEEGSLGTVSFLVPTFFDRSLLDCIIIYN